MAAIIVDDLKLLAQVGIQILNLEEHIRSSRHHNSYTDAYCDTLANYRCELSMLVMEYGSLGILYQAYGSPEQNQRRKTMDELHYKGLGRHIRQGTQRVIVNSEHVSNAFWRMTSAMQVEEMISWHADLGATFSFIFNDLAWIRDRRLQLFTDYSTLVKPSEVYRRRQILERESPIEGAFEYAFGPEPNVSHRNLPERLPANAQKWQDRHEDLKQKFRSEGLKQERQGHKAAKMEEKMHKKLTKLIEIIEAGDLSEKYLFVHGGNLLYKKGYKVIYPDRDIYPDIIGESFWNSARNFRYKDETIISALNHLEIFILDGDGAKASDTATYMERCRDCEQRACQTAGHVELDAFSTR